MLKAAQIQNEDAPRVVTPGCEDCGGNTQTRVSGTRFCCPTAELKSLRIYRAEMERRLSFELESPPLDSALVALLSWAYGRAKGLRRSEF